MSSILKKYTKLSYFTLVLMLLNLFYVTAISSKNDIRQKSEYQLFLQKQKSPLINAHKELFQLGGQIWQRDFGEKEYYLTISNSLVKNDPDKYRSGMLVKFV